MCAERVQEIIENGLVKCTFYFLMTITFLSGIIYSWFCVRLANWEQEYMSNAAQFILKALGLLACDPNLRTLFDEVGFLI